MPLLLTLELPTTLLEVLTPWVDFDFAISHRVLEDEAYARWYRNRKPGRVLILDNDTHEFGETTPLDNLLRAAEATLPDFIIPPDRPGDHTSALYSAWEFMEVMASRWGIEGVGKLALVLTGKTAEDREVFLRDAPKAEMLCFPGPCGGHWFDQPRLHWFLEHRPPHKWIHLLDVTTRPEIEAWVALSNLPSFRDRTFSVDTGKPVKWGYLNQPMSELPSWRRASISSLELLSKPFPGDASLKMIQRNVYYLHDLLNSHPTLLEEV